MFLRSTLPQVIKAAPELLRQSAQWQSTMLLGATRSSYRTFPQVHPPWTIVFFRLTRIRRKNPAFNYRFFHPGPLAFESEAGKNAGHDVTLSVQAARNNRKLLERVRDVRLNGVKLSTRRNSSSIYLISFVASGSRVPSCSVHDWDAGLAP